MKVLSALLLGVWAATAQESLQELWDAPNMGLEALFQLAEDSGEVTFHRDRSFVAETLGAGRGIFSKTKLHVDDEILSVRLNGSNSLFITMEDVLRSPLGSSKFLRDSLTPNGMLALFLSVHASYGTDSEWHAYLSSLPGYNKALTSTAKTIQDLKETGHDLRWLRGSSFRSVLEMRLKAISAEWQVVQKALYGTANEVDADTVAIRALLPSNQRITLGLYSWSLRMVFSRLHSIQTLVGEEGEEPRWVSRAMLLPIVDLFNYGPARATSAESALEMVQSKTVNVECFTTEDGVKYSCVANDEILPGEELFVDYSRRELNSFQLMLDYGFALPTVLAPRGRDVKTLMYNASVAQVPFFAVDDFETNPELREQKDELLKIVFGNDFDTFVNDGIWLERKDIVDVESFLRSPLMIVARIYSLSVNEIREARSLKINDKFMVEVLREGKPVSLKTERRALALLHDHTKGVLSDLVSDFGEEDYRAKLEQLGASLKTEWNRRLQLSADLTSCMIQKLSRLNSAKGAFSDHLVAANAIMEAKEASASCKLSFGLSTSFEADELAESDGVTQDGMWSDNRIFFTQLLCDEASILQDVQRILGLLRAEIREHLDKQINGAGPSNSAAEEL